VEDRVAEVKGGIIRFFSNLYSCPLDICQRLIDYKFVNEYEEDEKECCVYCFASLFERMVQSPHFITNTRKSFDCYRLPIYLY
jgi:hypothetical protein